MKFLLLAVFCGFCACALANYQSIDDSVSQGREFLKQTLEDLRQIAAGNEDIQKTVGNRIAQLQAQLENNTELTGLQAQLALNAILQGIDRVAQDLVSQIINNELASGAESVAVQLVIKAKLGGQSGSNQGYSSVGQQQQLVEQLRDQVEQDLQKLEKLVYQSLLLRQEYGEQVGQLRDQQRALAQEPGSRIVQSYIYLQGIIRNVYNSVVERIEGGLDYAAQEQPEGNQEEEQEQQEFEQQIQELQEQVKSQLQQIQDLINENSAIQTEFDSRLTQVKSQQESASQKSGYQAVRALLAIQRQIQQVYYTVIRRVKDLANPEQEQQLQQQIELLRQQIAAQLQQLESYLAQNNVEIQNQFEKRVSQLKIQQESIVQEVGYEGVRAILSLQQRIQKTFQYAIESVQQQQRQIQQVNQLREQLEAQLQQLESYVDQNEALKTQFDDRVSQLRQQQLSARELFGSGAIRALQSIQRQARQVARDAKKQQQQQDQIQQLRQQIENQLQQLEASVEQNEALRTEYANKLTQLRTQQQAVAQQTGSRAVRALEALQRNVRQVARSIQEQQRQQQQIQQLSQQIEEQLEQLEQVAALDEAIQSQYANKLSQLRSLQQSAGQQQGSRALRSLQSLQKRVRQVAKEIQKQVDQKQQIAQLQLQIDSQLKQAEDLIAQNVELQTKYADQLSELRTQQQSAAQQNGKQAIRALTSLLLRVHQVTVTIFADNQGEDQGEQQGQYQSEDTANSIRNTVILIRENLKTQDGIQVVRNYLNRLDKTNPRINLVRSFVRISSDNVLRQILSELFRPLEHIHIADYPRDSSKLGKLFSELRDQVTTDEGILVLKNYASGLKTLNPIVAQVKSVLKNAQPENVRIVLQEFFSGLEKSSSYQSEDTANSIRHTVILIRETLKTQDGLQVIKNYLNRLDTTNPRINLVRAFVQASSDDVLREILSEVFSPLDDIHIADYPADSENLGQLFSELRDQVTTDEGILVLKNYARGLQTTNPIVARVKTVVESAQPENIRIVLQALFSGLE